MSDRWSRTTCRQPLRHPAAEGPFATIVTAAAWSGIASDRFYGKLLMVSNDRPAARLATRLAFLVAGFGIACWAPLVPFAKQRLAIDDATLGLLLFCIGVGSVVAMQFTCVLSARYGAKPAIVAGGLGLTVILPFLSAVTTSPALAVARCSASGLRSDRSTSQ